MFIIIFYFEFKPLDKVHSLLLTCSITRNELLVCSFSYLSCGVQKHMALKPRASFTSVADSVLFFNI